MGWVAIDEKLVLTCTVHLADTLDPGFLPIAVSIGHAQRGRISTNNACGQQW